MQSQELEKIYNRFGKLGGSILVSIIAMVTVTVVGIIGLFQLGAFLLKNK